MNNSRPISDLSDFELIQTDIEIKEILEDIGINEEYNFLFVKLDKSGADYELIYGSNTADIEQYAELIYRKEVA